MGGVTAGSYFYCDQVQAECRDTVKAVSILPGSKNNNNNNHMAACGAVIKVLFSFQQGGFASRVTVSHLEKVNVHNCLGPAGAAGVSLDNVHGSHDHTSYPAGWGRCWMFSASLESWPGDFSGNRQPAATSPVGEVLSWQLAFPRHTLVLCQRCLP